MQARYWLAIAIVVVITGGTTLYALNLNPSEHLPRLKVTQADIDALIDRTYEQMVFVEGGEFLKRSGVWLRGAVPAASGKLVWAEHSAPWCSSQLNTIASL